MYSKWEETDSLKEMFLSSYPMSLEDRVAPVDVAMRVIGTRSTKLESEYGEDENEN